MFKWIISSWLIASSLFLMAQKNDHSYYNEDYKPKALFLTERYTISGDLTIENVNRKLIEKCPNLQSPYVGLQLNYCQESPGGFHYSFNQTFANHRVYQSEIKVNIDRKNTVRSVIDNSFDTKTWQLAAAPFAEAVVFYNFTTLRPEWSDVTVNEQEDEIVKSLEGDALYQRSLRVYKAAPDSIVTGKIFRPDPITTAQTTYQGNFKDNNNTNNADLEAQLQTVSFNTNFTGTKFTLENQHIKLVDFDGSTTLPVESTTPQFFYDRSQNGFEDVNAFYHLQNYQRYIKSLGFNLANGVVWVDTHADGIGDNSYFTPNNTPKRLYYGTGGVDDAEDADVVTHEYGHFLSDEAAPGSNVGNQRNSLDEAFGDYIAASYSRTFSNYKSEWVYNWDGHNEFWNGRIVNSTKKFPADLTTSIYKNGEMWSTAMMNIHDEIGRSATDSLIFQTHYSYAANMAMDDAAYMLIDADTLLNNGQYFCPIYKHLLAQGFLPFYANNPCGISSVESSTSAENILFFASPHQFSIQLENHRAASIRLLQLNGQVVTTMLVNQSRTTYENNHLPNGIYIVQIVADDLTSHSFKWCKTD